jgi:hypothetical protein
MSEEGEGEGEGEEAAEVEEEEAKAGLLNLECGGRCSDG